MTLRHFSLNSFAIALLGMVMIATAGCASLTGATPEQHEAQMRARTVLMCNGYARTMNSLALYREQGRLTPSQVNRIDTARPIFQASCQDGENQQPLGEATVENLEAMLVDLATVKETAK